MGFTVYQGMKFTPDGVEKVEDALTVEESLEMSLNGLPFSMTMRTPGNENELVLGYLHTEDIFSGDPENLKIEVLEENREKVIKKIDISIPGESMNSGYRSSRNFLSVSSCGICGKTELEDLTGHLFDGFHIESHEFEKLFDRLNVRQKNFIHSGGSHAAAAFDEQLEILSAMEDIGRHNAVDKVIGDLIRQGNLKKAKVLIVSGRISYEIVMKCFRAGIPVLAAVSAPSTLAVDFSKELGITLLGFCRKEKATCYANPQRILTNKRKHVKEFK